MSVISNQSYQALNAIFNSITSDSGGVLWMCAPDFSRQLYLSDNYKTVWKREPDILFDDINAWQTYLNKEDVTDIRNKLMSIHKSQATIVDLTYLYRVDLSDNTVRYIKDTCMPVYDNEGVLIAMSGVASAISKAEWEALKDPAAGKIKKADDVTFAGREKFEQALNDAFKLQLGKQPLSEDAGRHVIALGQPVKLTQREAQCLQYLAQGYSSKEIGRVISLSHRTIEQYIDNIRKKTGASSRIELLSTIENLKDVNFWRFSDNAS